MTSVPRPGSSLVAFWVLAGFAVLLVGDAGVRGDWHVFGLVLAPACLVVWLGWLLLYRPEIRFDARGIVITNPGRIHEIPWARTREIGQRLQIVVETDDGRKTSCWGSPFPEKPGLRRPIPGERRNRDPGSALVAALDSSRRSGTPGSAGVPIVRRWDTMPLAIGAVLVIACAVELLLVH